MIGPAYVYVPEGRKPIRVTVFRQSQRPQIVRIGGAHAPSKTSTIYEFNDVELRPKHGLSPEVMIPAQNTDEYWLAIQIFSCGTSGWSRSAIRANAPLANATAGTRPLMTARRVLFLEEAVQA